MISENGKSYLKMCIEFGTRPTNASLKPAYSGFPLWLSLCRYKLNRIFYGRP